MNPQPPLRHLISALCLSMPLFGQDFEAPLVSAPSGYTEPTTFSGFDVGEALSGFSFGLGSTLAYDSNVRGSGPVRSGEGDTILSVSPTITYRDPGGDFTFGGSFALNYATYFSNSDLGGLGYSTNLHAGYQGGRFSLKGTFGSSLRQGTNNYYNNSYAETLSFNTGLSLDYRLSPKTSINSRFNYNWTEPTSGNFASTYNLGFDIAALWKATPLTSLGPGIAWDQSGGDNRPDRQTLGPILRVKYKLSRKVALDGTFGYQFYQSGGGSQDGGFTTGLGLNYRASSLWGMNLSVYKGTTANGGIGGGYRDSTNYRLGYHRKIRRAQLTTGIGYEISDVSGGVAGGQDQDNFNWDIALGMPVFYNRVQASLFYRWRSNSGNNVRSNDGYTTGISLSTGF
ncbi:hypothetical protein [Luteolibacter marinus]|uniref:hypothetical protein n=1 Tax=Luteolibacter marinus TaxID=2776705 RepID=UPI001866D5E7|nr:hypothetical protein [Luteolibacter marinus]